MRESLEYTSQFSTRQLDMGTFPTYSKTCRMATMSSICTLQKSFLPMALLVCGSSIFLSKKRRYISSFCLFIVSLKVSLVLFVFGSLCFPANRQCLRLRNEHMYSFWGPQCGDLNILLALQVILELDVYDEVGSNNALILSVSTMTSDGTILVTFEGVIGSPTISAICIRSGPPTCKHNVCLLF